MRHQPILVHVTLRCTETGSELADVPAQLDSAADRTVVRSVQTAGELHSSCNVFAIGIRALSRSMKKKRLLLGLALVIAIATIAVLSDPTCVLLGLLRNESFYEGRPTTYWSREIQQLRGP